MVAAHVETLTLLRSRLCDPSFAHAAFNSAPDSNYSKLKYLISDSISNACNKSLLLLGPRGCGKIQVLDLVIRDLKAANPDTISVIRLHGLLHSDDNGALKEIARQLCLEHQLLFSKMASSDDNSKFVLDMLRECGLAHKTIVFLLDEFDLFAQGKQRLLYTLLDAMQTLISQAVLVGVSCRVDADQLLEKRVRSRFSHTKLLFFPPPSDDIPKLLEHLLYLPDDSVPTTYGTEFNSRLHNIFSVKEYKQILDSLSNDDGTISNLLRYLFRAVSSMDLESGFLTLDNFKCARICTQRQPKLDKVHDASILELYMLVCMNRLEVKEKASYNFNSIMTEYKELQHTYKTCDDYSRTVCLRAVEHLLEQELVSFTDSKGRGQSIEFRPLKLLISPRELYQQLKSHSSCPALLQRLFAHESYK